MVYKLVIPPDQSSYSVKDGEDVISQRLDGGASRYRADILNPSKTVNCQWTVGPDDFDYIRSFYNVVHRQGVFLIDLYVDSSILTEHEAYFIPNTMTLSSQRGQTFTVTCQLEVLPIDTTDYDESYLDMMTIYGSSENAIEALNILEKLVNVDLAEIS